MKHPILVNRNRRISTLKDKAELTGFRFARPQNLPDGAEPFTVHDVNGKTHSTIIKRHTDKKDVIGIEDRTLPGKYHGKDSRNWVPESHTADSIINILNAGYSVAPGLYENPPDKSHRSSNYYAWTDVILFDGDEWTETHTAPESIDALIKKYPTIPDHFYWIAESISSRSSLKPYLNTRLMMILPEPIRRGDPWTWNAMVEWVTELYPFIAAGVAADKVRLSFGNARPDRTEQHFGKVLDTETLNLFRQHGAAALAEHTFAEIEKAKKSKSQTQRREKSERITTELKAKGVVIPDTQEPISTFNKTDIETLLIDLGCSQVRGNDWHWHESGQGKSFTLHADNPPVIECYSNSIKAHNPNGNDNKPVEAHRLIAYYLYGLDMSKDSDKPELRKRLAEDGYGTSPEDWQQVQDLKRTAAQIKGITKPKLSQVSDNNLVGSQRLEDNEKAREAAVANFATDTKPERTQIHIVSDQTGSGKSHTVLTKAKTENKKTLASLPFYEQAEQAVETAATLGFSPFFIKGREHGWEASGIEAIPVEYRTESLFKNENVGCIMCDKTREYQAKRQPARLFCETKCPYRETCLDIGHLSQYKIAAASDFIATCTPNLLFDPTFKGYLNVLINLGEDNTDDDDIGFTNNPKNDDDTEKQVFDTAIIEDFVLNSLYPETHTTLTEIQQLRDLWTGTPTETFAESLLPAFTETDNAKIFDVLESAVKSLTESDRSEINRILTQHGRVGTIHKLNRPKGSAETRKRLTGFEIKFVDGGRRFIPDSEEAEKELNKKSFPCVPLENIPKAWKDTDTVTIPVEPYKALQVYKIPIKDLTPVWQKSWTLLDQIEKLIATTGTRENAPVWIKDSTLSMSLPPQDSGLVDHIALLSPTDESAAIKQGFTGQDIDFHVATGKPINFANDVEIYQLSDYRLTAASVFEYKTDANNKRILQEKPTHLKAKTLKRFSKLNDWARNTEGITAFISYKDIAEDFTEHLNNFDIITHFDRIAGLNLDGLKLLVVYGYPKVNHVDVIPEAIKQFSGDTEPIPSGDYEELTEEKEWNDNGILITERRYIDSRLESIRKRLATEKLNQAVGRARLPRWTGTTTMIITNAPIPAITDRAELFTDAAFTAAHHPRDFTDAQKRIELALEAGNVNAIQETQGVSQRTAYRQRKQSGTAETSKAERDTEIFRRYDAGETQQAISDTLIAEGYKASLRTVKNVLKSRPF